MVLLNKKGKLFLISLVSIIILIFISIFIIIKKSFGPVTIHLKNKEIRAEQAVTPAALYRGLSGRASLCPDCGLLFVFPDEAERKFVMREMNFPLDIIFINHGRVIKIASNLAPEGKSPLNVYSSEQPADRALEVNGGWAAKNNLQVGDQIIVER